MLGSPLILASIAAFYGLPLAAGQFPPAREGVTTLKSKFHEGIEISYKKPGICETTPGVRSYSGYIHIPPHTLTEPGESQECPVNTFFWFFESRKDPHNAPLSIWLNGGPGGSSLVGALAENGPCFIGADSNSTYLNEWSWNNEVNMLYIDQPNQVGFSYGIATNITMDLLANLEAGEEATHVADFSKEVPEQNSTFLVGTLGSHNENFTANSTHHAAVALWHFAQTWFEEFPAYKPHDEKISLWTESYGGKYGPAFMQYFQGQNELIANGTIKEPGAHFLHLDTLGIINGCIDSLYQDKAYLKMAMNNTYGLKALNETTYHRLMYEFDKPGGLLDRVKECQKLAREADPNESGAIEKVNEVCTQVHNEHFSYVGPYMETGKHAWFDITHPREDPFPPMYFAGYLNQHWVQKALGTPVNHTWESAAVAEAFHNTGDMIRGGPLEQIAYLLDSGVKVAIIAGDRDFACNWIGGEVVSKNIPYRNQTQFNNAGYQPLVTNPFYSGGRTRQYGNFSYSRIFQAGHMVPSYQPETAYRVFMRSLFNKDIATGSRDLTSDYSTEGPSETWELSDVLPAPEPQCYSYFSMSCTDEHREWLRDGTAIVKDWVVVGRNTSGLGVSNHVENLDIDGQRVLKSGN